MASIPAWQTEELGEEWVEASPSPPGSPAREAPSAPVATNKRGSMRALGAGAPRPLPPSRKGSANVPGDFGRSPSNPYIRSASGMLSPPTSASGSDGDARERERERDRNREQDDSNTSSSIPRETSPTPSTSNPFHSTTTNTIKHNTVASEPVAGTFLVKEGEDSHGKAFPKNPFQKDIFAALALEKMFEPPSPPVASTSAALPSVPENPGDEAERERSDSPRSWNESEHSTPTSVKARDFAVSPVSDTSPASASGSVKSANSSSPATSSSSHTAGTERRVSHQYAPVHPSRLSKSVTPSSDSSFANTTEVTQDTFNAEASHDIHAEDGPTVDYHTRTHDGPTLDGPTVDYHTAEPSSEVDAVNPEDEQLSPCGTTREVPSENPSPERPLSASEHSEDESEGPPLANRKYPFTFTAPVPHIARDKPVFDPSLAPLQSGEPSSSTLRNVPESGLRLFRNTYDTYTREQLSALVDSIAVGPSPPAAQPSKLRQWSPADSETPLRSNSSGSASTPVSGSSADARSNKRLRLSPPSPHGAAGTQPLRTGGVVRDWQAHGRALMDRIRVTDPEISATDESKSGTGTMSWDSDSREYRSRTAATPLSDGISGYNGAPTFDYSAASPGGHIMDSPSQLDHQGPFRSNPSTASSTYLHRAEDMMSRIKSRVVSPSTSTTVESPRFPRRNLSESSRETYTTSESDQRGPRLNATFGMGGSRTTAVQPPSSESDESKDMSIEDDQAEDEDVPRPAVQRSGSRTSVEGAGLPSQLPVNRDDLNRFMSASTYTTGTTVSTSFVKHPGPRDPAMAPVMTQIRPGDVPGALAERVGGMRYDRKANRWVRDVSGGLGRVDEAGESRTHGSEDSVDVFAGIESIHSGERSRSTINRSLPRHSSLLRGQSAPVQQDLDETDTTEDDADPDPERTPRPPPAHRPRAHHSNSAPPMLKTPGPATPGVLRSALRNANSTPASAMKKQAAWHPDLTPAPDGRQGSAEVSYRRSVSFSDNYIAPPRSAGGSWRRKPNDKEAEAEEEALAGDQTTGTNASFMPSMRTRRIQDALDAMADMTLADATPTKTPKERSTRQQEKEDEKAPSENEKDEIETEDTEDDDTVEPVPFGGMRSFRSRTAGRAGDATFLTECSFGVAHDRLVELITDVQPFEPYWEQLRTIDLSNKGVESLARLKEFLPQLDEARLENNSIDYLSGIPNTVRTLHVAGNHLSSLTSVNHLRNLQYLDISRNQLDSVSQLECLRHLRELKMDNNAITDLSGIMSMDSLLKLSVSGNKIESVNFSMCKWDKLESLNLSNNKIKTVVGLHKLKSLATLNLDKNALTEIEVAAPMQAVRTLRFCDNDVSFIDLSHFPKLRTLFADNNQLAGLSRSLPTGGHRVENLSVRNQRVGNLTLSAEDLQSVKRLYVSGNRLDPDFLPRSPLFHLVYLEAAACNLNAWPADFGKRAPNLRILNVNYNFLADLDGLAGMVWLRKLMVVGNRLGGGGPAAVRGLTGLTALEEVDLRMNPATLSFYLPIMLPSPTKSKDKDAKNSSGVPADGSWPALDAQFRRQLPDEWYSKRLVYRGLVMAACPDVRTLDGVVVEEGEKRKAAMLLEYAGASLQ